MADASEINDLKSRIQALREGLPSNGLELWRTSANLNFLWLRGRFPDCKGHDVINAIDSEGEGLFEDEHVRSSRARDFYDLYIDHFVTALGDMMNALSPPDRPNDRPA